MMAVLAYMAVLAEYRARPPTPPTTPTSPRGCRLSKPRPTKRHASRICRHGTERRRRDRARSARRGHRATRRRRPLRTPAPAAAQRRRSSPYLGAVMPRRHATCRLGPRRSPRRPTALSLGRQMACLPSPTTSTTTSGGTPMTRIAVWKRESAAAIRRARLSMVRDTTW